MRAVWPAMVAALAALAGCRDRTPAPPAAPVGGPTAVATIFPLADITRQIAGDGFTVLSLVPAGASPHTFEPAPAQVKSIADAVVIVRAGGGADRWIQGLLGGSKGCVVTAMGVTRLLPAVVDPDEPPPPASGPDVDLFKSDPHVWLDPIRVRDDIAPAIAEALKQAAPAEAAGIDGRLKTCQAGLTKLDADIRALLAGCSEKRYIATHAAWAYLNERYGLELAATVEEQPGRDPSAQWLKQVIDVAQQKHVKAIFAEQQLSDKLVKVVAAETGMHAGVLDPEGGEGVAGRDSYGELLLYNARQLAEGLR
ncbi:MAG: zinc ABC transporter substrate-binding protein [Armatimonadetes bacterium]|nr:zinc ABC transporter substrate-binding protein [Armatimonadota bacterium]